MNHVSAAFRIGGEEVEVYLGAGCEDEPAALCANSKVAADAVHVVDGFVEHDTRDYSYIPAVFVVLVDVAEFEGKDDGVSGGCGFFDIVGGCSDFIARDAEVAVAKGNYSAIFVLSQIGH